jgi:hypothetical protein
LDSSFWNANGFEPADPSWRVPAEFSDSQKSLSALQLGPEPPPNAGAIAEFGMMQEGSRGQQKRFLARVEVIAVVVPLLVFFAVKSIHLYHLSTIRVPPPKISSVKVVRVKVNLSETNSAATNNHATLR